MTDDLGDGDCQDSCGCEVQWHEPVNQDSAGFGDSWSLIHVPCGELHDRVEKECHGHSNRRNQGQWP